MEELGLSFALLVANHLVVVRTIFILKRFENWAKAITLFCPYLNKHKFSFSSLPTIAKDYSSVLQCAIRFLFTEA